MRVVRRLAAAATYLLTIHLTIVGGTVSCPEGWTAQQESGAAAMQMHDGDMPSSQPGHHHSQSGSHCKTPCTTVGCSVSAHCGVSAVGGSRHWASVEQRARQPLVSV